MNAVRWFAVTIAASALSGCTDRLCNDIGVHYGLILELEHGTHEGAYQLQLTAEERMMIVDYSIAADGQPTCVEGCQDRADPLTINPESGFGSPLLSYPDNTLNLSVRRMTDPVWGPDAFHLRIYRDEVLAHDQDYHPTYDVSEPWGEGCGEDVVSLVPVDLTR